MMGHGKRFVVSCVLFPVRHVDDVEFRLVGERGSVLVPLGGTPLSKTPEVINTLNIHHHHLDLKNGFPDYAREKATHCTALL